MKNKLEESWNNHKLKTPSTTNWKRDRLNFQCGFNTAFKLFKKTDVITHPADAKSCAADKDFSCCCKAHGSKGLCLYFLDGECSHPSR